MEETLSPAPATTAEEAMASSGDRGERGAPPGDSTTSSGDTQCPAGAPTRREEAANEVEQWAAAVPPVRNKVFLTITCLCCKSVAHVSISFFGL